MRPTAFASPFLCQAGRRRASESLQIGLLAPPSSPSLPPSAIRFEPNAPSRRVRTKNETCPSTSPSLPPFHLLPSVSISVFAAMSCGMPRIEVELPSPIKVDPSIPRARALVSLEGGKGESEVVTNHHRSIQRSVDRHMRRSHTSACLVFAPYVLTAHPLSCVAQGVREKRDMRKFRRIACLTPNERFPPSA